MSILRDHYAGTPFDTTLPENGGGEYGCPHPPFKIPTPYPRPIDMFNTQSSYIAQSRANLPHTIGGVVWFAFHSPSTGCYVPFYAAGTRLATAYATGEPEKEAAFWRFFTLGNMVNQRWRDLYNRVRDTYDRLEQNWMERQFSIEKEALGLLQKDESLARTFLTGYSESSAQEALSDLPKTYLRHTVPPCRIYNERNPRRAHGGCPHLKQPSNVMPFLNNPG